MKKIINKNWILILTFLVITDFAHAIDFSGFITNSINKIIVNLSYLSFAFAIVFFFWGIFQYVLSFSTDASNKRKEGLNKILYGIIAIFVMVSFWGLLAFLMNSINLDGNSSWVKSNLRFGGGDSSSGGWMDAGAGGVRYDDHRSDLGE